MAARVSSKDFDEKVLQSEKTVLVDFYSDTCIPCKKLSPVLGDIEDDMEERLQIYKVNTNYDADLAAAHRVMSVPTLIIYKNGKAVGRKTGETDKAEITKWIEQNL